MEKMPLPGFKPLALRITIAKICILAFVLTTNAKTVSGQEILDRTISINVEKTRLKNILLQIQAATDAKFVFCSTIIEANQKVNYTAKDEKIRDVLTQLLTPLHVNFKVFGDQIVLFGAGAPAPQFQGIPVHGKITDANGKPLPGATVTVKGSTISTTTDENGNFSFREIDEKSVLVVTYVGYGNREIPVSGNSNLSVVLEESKNSLNQVIVIGYGTARKKDVVGALDVIAAKDAGNTASTNASELLIGKSAGVQVVQANGTPGADAQILIRGTGSFTSIDPLYVIDGIQGSKNLFNAISPADIADITVLKDASQTAIYGAAAANGVVLVTTKKSKSGTPKVSFSSQWGTAAAWKQLHLLNATQYVDLLKDFAATNNTVLPAKFSTSSVLVDSNDWQKQIFRNALVSENTVSLTGGSEKVLYTFSLGYITKQSTIRSLENDRVNSRFSLDETLGRFHFGQSLSIRYTKTRGQMANITDAIQYAPYKPVYDPTVLGGYSILTNVGDFSNVNNPLQAINLVHPKSSEYVFLPQAFGEVNLIRGLKFRSQFQMEIGGGKGSTYQYPYTASNNLSSPRQATLNYNDYSYYILENYFSYNHEFGKHSISATLGNSYIDPGSSAYVQATGTNIPNDNIQNVSVAQSLAVTGATYGYARASMISYFGRVGYTYDDKYILFGSIRRDGASNFGVNNQFGTFYGTGAAWRFTNEKFFEKNAILTDGKLRIGWGRTGNNNIPTTGITSVLTFSGNPNGNLVYSLGTGEAFNAGTTITTLANPDIKWEQTDQTNIGIDLTLLNKINLTVDWYNRESSGLLVSTPVPASTGASQNGAQPVKTVNAADAYNRGVEITLGYSNSVSKDLSYNVSANLAFNKNECTSLGAQFAAPIQTGTFQNLNNFIYTAAGYPIGSFYGYKLDHVAKDQAEIDALNAKAVQKTGDPTAVYQAGLKPGDFIFKDLNGNGMVTDSDQTALGNAIPRLIYGFNASVNFKRFDFNLVVSGVAGLKLLNALKFQTQIEATGHNATTDILNRWRNPGDVAQLPRAGQDVTGDLNLRPSDWWLQSGDYARLRNITIGYTLPIAAINKLTGNAFTRIRCYVSAQNLVTLTKYSGYDPEVSTQSSGSYIFTRGIDDGQIPQPRIFMAGVQLGF